MFDPTRFKIESAYPKCNHNANNMFCIAIPLGLARENKGVAAFAGFVGYAVMCTGCFHQGDGFPKRLA